VGREEVKSRCQKWWLASPHPSATSAFNDWFNETWPDVCLKGYQLRLQIFFIMGLSLEWEALLLEESVRGLEFYFSDEPSSNIWTWRFEDLWDPALMEPSKTNCTIENAWQFGGLARDDPWDPAGGFVLRYCTMKKEILHEVVLPILSYLSKMWGMCHTSFFITKSGHVITLIACLLFWLNNWSGEEKNELSNGILSCTVSLLNWLSYQTKWMVIACTFFFFFWVQISKV
jgi:hypothetical protein